MTSERVQRRIDALLDEAEAAVTATDWALVRQRCEAVLALDPGNADALAYRAAADRATGAVASAGAPVPAQVSPAPSGPETFANGRYEVVRFLGEGGRKKVYLAKDALLDRQVAFALIKTEGLDEAARERITREAQTMGRLGNHPNLVTVLDIGEHTDAQGVTFPWIAIELLPGGDVEGLLEKAGGPLPLDRTLKLGIEVSRGLEFLHSKGVVHRDLKPGNVWLTADGTAKIGDYGLAMTADHTRLTLQGTMVGTVDYMPPEQALGGEITARSDLYSLGAMLYELVTGKPMFSGERIAEVISQHINVMPPAPSERGAQIPSALDALIMELVAKNPSERPVSATAVRERLEAVDPHDLPTVFDEEYRLRRARQVFVGRTRELEELKHRFDEAAAGQSRIVVLVGQPGIGKTRLSQELEAYARTRNARVLWGRAPEGGGAPEHWMFTQMLRRFLDEVDETTARRLLGDDASQLARIAPEISERLRIPVTTDTAEFALQEAARTFLHRLAEDRPLLVILDDLHWADQASLALLQHTSRDLATARVMILGTYRDTELSRTHPLSVALATLNRESNFHRIAVRGLDREQVSAYIQRTARFEPTREQLDLFMRETDGNPFFLSEIVAGMLERGTLDDRTYELEIPDGMREALSRRVNVLSEDAVELLKLAAVVGYEFDFPTLSVVSEQTEDRELELIEEALRDHVIAEGERAGSYRFVYEPMQRLLLDELSSTRRLRLHGQIGEQLETSFGQQAEQHAAVLARHFSESSAVTPAHREKALRYCWLAGQQAEATEELGAAVRWYERSLELLRAGVRASDVEETDALAAWGGAMAATTGSQRAIDAIRTAVGGFATQGNGVKAGRAALSLQTMVVPAIERISILSLAIDALNAKDPILEAQLLAARAVVLLDAGGDADAAKATDLAIRHQLSGVLATIRRRESALAASNADYGKALSLVSEAIDLSRSAGDAVGSRSGELAACTNAFRAGDLDAVLRFSERRAQPGAPQGGGPMDPLIFAFRAAVLLHRRAPEFEQFSRERGSPGASIDLLVLPMFWEAAGQLQRALRFATDADESEARWVGAATYGAGTIARLALALGDTERARSALERVRPSLFDDREYTEWGRANAAAWADQALISLLDHDSLAKVADRRWEANDGTPLVASAMFGSFDRTRAMWALALDRLDEAERLVRRGLEWCVRERCPVEEGRCQQLLAQVLTRKGEDAEARSHLDAASTLFQQHGARLYLDQVLEQRDLLKA